MAKALHLQCGRLGSSPTVSTKFALIAQWLESDAYIVKVTGSSPVGSTAKSNLESIVTR